MKFAATAEHTSGQSVSHPCRTGAYDDPTESWQPEIEADSLAGAQMAAQRDLAARVAGWNQCVCGRSKYVGNNDWWNSVAISLWPQDADALAAWLSDGGDVSDDCYGLIPDDVKVLA